MGNLSHLDELEAEAIYIIREVAAECENPVMLYSIGKDSSVMLHLAMKAFYPEKPPFPFLHIDTTWKFKEMIQFRDHIAEKMGIEMLVYTNEEGVKAGINPFDHGSAYTDIMKTQALKQALNKYQFTAAFGGGRSDEEKSRAKERIFSFRNASTGMGSEKPASGNVEALQHKDPQGRKYPCLPDFPTGRKKTSGSTLSVKTLKSCRYTLQRNVR